MLSTFAVSGGRLKNAAFAAHFSRPPENPPSSRARPSKRECTHATLSAFLSSYSRLDIRPLLVPFSFLSPLLSPSLQNHFAFLSLLFFLFPSLSDLGQLPVVSFSRAAYVRTCVGEREKVIYFMIELLCPGERDSLRERERIFLKRR